MARSRKFKRGSGPRFVQLYYWIMDTSAYQNLSCGARSLLLELLKEYNGFNNGSVYLSHRDAAKRLSCNKGTVGSYFADLRDKGFIVITRGHTLGADGKGEATHYALTMESLDGNPPTNEFKDWKK